MPTPRAQRQHARAARERWLEPGSPRRFSVDRPEQSPRGPHRGSRSAGGRWGPDAPPGGSPRALPLVLSPVADARSVADHATLDGLGDSLNLVSALGADADDGLVLPDKAARVKLFASIDRNGSGKLSVGEFQSGLLSAWGPALFHKASLKRAFDAADVDRGGYITRREFKLVLE